MTEFSIKIFMNIHVEIDSNKQTCVTRRSNDYPSIHIYKTLSMMLKLN